MTIAQFQYFLAATEAGSLTQAAEEVGVSQPALSDQIRKLEQNLGVSLFTRAKRGLTLTEAGRKFLPHARRVANDYSDAVASVEGIRDLESGTVSFGMFNTGMIVLPDLIPAYRAQFPKVSIRVVGANSAQIADMVRNGRLEAALVMLPIDARGLTIGDVLWSCEAVYFHKDPASTVAPVTIADLTKRPLVLPDIGWADTDPTRRMLSMRAQRLGRPLVPDIEVESGVAALALAASGVAGAVVSLPTAEALGYTSKLHWASLDPPLIETSAVITRDPQNLSPATKAMIELVNRHMRMLHQAYDPAENPPAAPA